MVKDIIDTITQKYYNETEEYYSEYRYDEVDNEFEIEQELEEVLTKNNIKFIIEKKEGFSSCSYENSFLAISYIEEGKLNLELIRLECK